MCAVQETDIVRKLLTNRASTSDMHNNTVSVGDYVTIVDTAAAAKAGPGGKKERGGEAHAACPREGRTVGKACTACKGNLNVAL